MATTYDVLAETEAILSGERTHTSGARTRWIQWQGSDARGGYCLQGALANACARLHANDDMYSAAWQYLHYVTGQNLTGFNDADGRTFAQVLNALQAAKEKAGKEADPLEDIPVLAQDPPVQELVDA